MKNEGNDSPAPSTEVISSSFHKRSVSNLNQTRHDEVLQGSLNETKEMIEKLQGEKKSLKMFYHKTLENHIRKIEKNKEIIEKIDVRLENLEKKHSSMNKAVRSEKIMKVEAFKIALQPLQNSADLIETSKSLAFNKLIDFQQGIFVLMKEKEEKGEHFNKKCSELTELTSRLSDLTNTLEKIKNENIWEYKEVFYEKKAIDKISTIKAQRTEKSQALKALTSEIEEIEKNIQQLTDGSMSSNEFPSISSSLSSNDSSLLQLEEFLSLQSIKHSTPTLPDCIENLSEKLGCSIKSCILREQVKLVKQKKLDMIEESKHSEGVFEKEFYLIDLDMKELEAKHFDMVAKGKKGGVESELNEKRKRLKEMREKYEEKKRENKYKEEVIDEWLGRFRKYLVGDFNGGLPDDKTVVDEYLERVKERNVEKGEENALKSVVERYTEGATIRNNLFIKLNELANEDNIHASLKLQELAQYKAVKKTKELEMSSLSAALNKLVKIEKGLMKDFESFKLEIDSGRKKNFHDYIQSSNPSDEVKQAFIKSQKDCVNTLRKLSIEKSLLTSQVSSLSKEIRENIKPAYERASQALIEKQQEIQRLEEDCILLEDSKEELLEKISSLAGKKKEEMICSVRKLAKDYGGERLGDMDKLCLMRNNKESECIDHEVQIINIQKELAEKELAKTLEIVRMNAKAQAIEKELSEVMKKKRKRGGQMSMGGISSTCIFESYGGASKNKAEIYTPQKVMLASSEVLNRSIKSKSSCRSIIRDFIDTENNQDITMEIPVPPESEFILSDNSSAQEKALFALLLPLLKGSVLYKKLVVKAAKPFDPLESTVLPPEECGFVLKKFKLNKALTKIEIRNIGKSGVENSIMIDTLISVNHPTFTTQILKAQNSTHENLDMSLESLASYSKTYREMKYHGKLNFSSLAFIARAKESHHYPFEVILKSGKTEFIADSSSDYESWTSGLSALIKHKKLNETLRFKIKST